MGELPLVAVRRLKRGKAHRPYRATADGSILGSTVVCGQVVPADVREVVPLEQTAPEDRCRKCWPEPPAARS